MPYECGKDPVGSARERFSVKFYLIAMIFILFDIEVIFLVPWAVVFKTLAAQGDGMRSFVMSNDDLYRTVVRWLYLRRQKGRIRLG